MLSVSDYVTTNVTAQPVIFLHETNHGFAEVSHTFLIRAAVILSLLPENNLSDTR